MGVDAPYREHLNHGEWRKKPQGEPIQSVPRRHMPRSDTSNLALAVEHLHELRGILREDQSGPIREWQDLDQGEVGGFGRRISRARQKEDTDLAQRFRKLVEWWEGDTFYLSSVTSMVIHPAYQRIIGMGPAVLPLLLHELELTRDHWLWALNAITGEDPASEGASFHEAVEAWLAWGKERGYL